MKNLLRYEIRRLCRAKSFYICLGVLAAYIFLSVLVQQVVYAALADTDAAGVSLTAADMLQSALTSGLTEVILGIFAALFLCEDYTDGTLKNICAKGYGLGEVYLVKGLVLCLFTLAACAVEWLCAYGFGLLFFADGKIDGDLILSLAAQLVVALGYTVMFFSVSAVIRKTGGAVAGCIVAPMLVSLVFSLADSFLEIEDFFFSDYWLDALLSSAAAGENLAMVFVLSLFYGAVFVLVGTLCNRKRDI